MIFRAERREMVKIATTTAILHSKAGRSGEVISLRRVLFNREVLVLGASRGVVMLEGTR